MNTKHFYIYSLLICFLMGSCNAQEQKKQYSSVYTDLEYYKLNGPVRMIRSFAKTNYKELTKDQIKLNDIQGVVYRVLGIGYFEFDKNGIKSKFHVLRDSINQVLTDTIRVYKKNDGVKDIYIYIYMIKKIINVKQPLHKHSKHLNGYLIHIGYA